MGNFVQRTAAGAPEQGKGVTPHEDVLGFQHPSEIEDFAWMGEGIMGATAERSPGEWFESAVRSYVEGHQACPWCDCKHCVFRTEWENRIDYLCSACDFSVCFDRRSGSHYMTRGEMESAKQFLAGLPAPRSTGGSRILS
jgi:hypothetical protein